MKLDAKLDSGFGNVETAKADKSDIDRALRLLDYLVDQPSADGIECAT